MALLPLRQLLSQLRALSWSPADEVPLPPSSPEGWACSDLLGPLLKLTPRVASQSRKMVLTNVSGEAQRRRLLPVVALQVKEWIQAQLSLGSAQPLLDTLPLRGSSALRGPLQIPLQAWTEWSLQAALRSDWNMLCAFQGLKVRGVPSSTF